MRRAIAAGVAVTMLLAAAGCHPRPGRVVIGIGLASNSYPGVMLAVNEINAAGGINGVRLEVEGLYWKAIDDPYNPVDTLARANRFAQNQDLLAVIGHSDSVSTLSAASSYNANGVPQIVTIATNPAITGIGPWTYRMCLSDAAQGPALAEYAVNDWKKRRIAIFFVNDDYGSGLAQRFERRARDLGATIVGTFPHRNTLTEDDDEAIRMALTRLKEREAPDLIALFQRIGAAQHTLRAMREIGLQADVLGSDNLAQYQLTDPPELAQGVRVSQFFSEDSANPRATRFARAFQDVTGKKPDYSHAFAYDAVYLLRDAIAGGGYSRAGVKAYLDRLIADQTQIDGAGGPFRFGADHDARRSLFVAEVRGGQFYVIQALPVR